MRKPESREEREKRWGTFNVGKRGEKKKWIYDG